MKTVLAVALLITLFSLPGYSDQVSCNQSQKDRLTDELIKKLTVKVCPHENSSDPDVYMEYDKNLESLNGAEFLIYEYSDNCYQKINSEIFKLTNQNQDTIKLAQQLDAVLCDYPKTKENVFRGAKLPDAIVENYLKAEIISIPAFTSTSKAFHIACEFARKNGNTFMKISSQSGRTIEKLSKHEDELEVLFRMNTRFKVKTAVSGFQASLISGCKGVSHYFELEEIYADEETKPFVWPY